MLENLNEKKMSKWTWDESAQWISKSIDDDAIDCNPRVLEILLKLEEKYMPVPNYFQLVQTDGVAPWMRKMVTTWMLEVRFYLFCIISFSKLKIFYN